ncbi:MAG: hypothetical protein A2516_08160 [Alphaproteobacteria bacterium RIFOXYD12_FULL_60_8]|nr:MAG: hypothetical protein A2516_08160 [Alphaproteobacteria bacterium RIFOXYD12_FULL_60_8]
MNQIATIKPGALPDVARRHSALLARPEGAFRTPVVAINEKLIPRDEAEALRTHLIGKLAVMTDKQALELTDLMLGAYVNAKPHNPAVYVSSVAAVFQAYPFDIGRKAVDEVRLNLCPKFPPNAGEIKQALDAERAKRTYAIRVLEAHLAEHERRAKDKPQGRLVADMPQEERDAFLSAQMARYRAAAEAKVSTPNAAGGEG